MGNWNSGRRPQPTALKVLRGNPSRRRLNAAEPHPPPVTDAFDTPPSPLADDPLAQVEWRRVAPMMRSCGMVSEAEATALIALCQQWSRYLEAQAKVRSMGMLIKAASGEPVTNPYLAVADKALTQCQHLWRELGLTPSSRSRMTVHPTTAPPVSKWAGLL